MLSNWKGGNLKKKDFQPETVWKGWTEQIYTGFIYMLLDQTEKSNFSTKIFALWSDKLFKQGD